MTKLKNNKKFINDNKKGTLDQKHTEKINKFERLENSLQQKKQKLNRFVEEYNEICEKNPKKITHEDIRRKSELRENISKIKHEIQKIENHEDELEYIVSTRDILVNYYDNDQVNDTEEDFVEVSIVEKPTSRKNILSYLMKQAKPPPSLPKPKQIKKNVSFNEENKNIREDSLSTSEDNDKKNISRASLYEDYLSVIDNSHAGPKKNHSTILCSSCKKGEKVLCTTDGCFVCKKCGYEEKILIGNDKLNYKEPSQESGAYAYKRINHLTEILSQLQAKESTDIPPKIFDIVNKEIKKRKIDKNDLDIFFLRKILKKLGLRKYYEHAPHMLQIINGKEPPNFSRKDEQKMKQMFKDIQKPFEICCPKSRKNFLNYSYVLHKFCELLELDQYLEYFPLLKNNVKLKQHDKIWKNICKHMRWKYYKSI